MHQTRIRTWLVAGGAVLGLVAGCSAVQQQTAGRPTHESATGKAASSPTPKPRPKPKPQAHISVSPADRSIGLSPLRPIVITATRGRLQSVAVSTGSIGIVGKKNRAGTRWTSTVRLAYAHTYRIRATATDAHGLVTRVASKFATVRPRAAIFTPVTPLPAMTVGVGYPIVVYFNHPVVNTAEVEKHMSVSAVPNQEGAWHWFGNETEAHWRPRVYWRAHSRVTLHLNLYGVNLGNGLWGKSDRTLHFGIGERHVSIANSLTHRLLVYRGDKLIRNFPVSMGREVKGRWTHSGVHVVNDKNANQRMDSRTFGLALDAGGYNAIVHWATRISDNGEFVHSAPWSVAQQGKENVSHGCINLSPKRARWFFDFSRVGDVVDVIGTPVPLTPADGDIYDWTIPWNQWATG